MRAEVQDKKSITLPTPIGFRDGATSTHTSRTMMLEELALVLASVAANARADTYQAAIVENNALGKPTQTTRSRTAQRLSELYALDPKCTLFRLLRHFWDVDTATRPVLAFLLAAARDPLLRETTPFVLSLSIGSAVAPDQIASYVGERYPKRFGASTLAATAQRLASSWTQAGFLVGKVKKKRARLSVTPVTVAFAILLGYLCGLQGKLLLDSIWTRLLDRAPAEIAELATEASRQGWMTFKAAGDVIEATFPGLLTPQEEKIANDPD